MTKVSIRGKEFDIRLPALDLREDLVYSYGAKWKANQTGMPLQRVCAAMIFLCVPEIALGLQLQTEPRDDLFVYGGEAYNLFREKKVWAPADILAAGSQIVAVLYAETFPREKEVEEARKNSEGGAR